MSIGLEVSLLTFLFVDDLSIGDSRIMQSPTVIVLRSICPFNSSSAHLMNLGALISDTYMLTTVISS
jgi:hypothetical protein